MRTLKVFILTQQGRDDNDQDKLIILGAYSTKTAAKEKMREVQEELLHNYQENYPDEYEEYEEGFGINWGISCKDFPVFDELLITEKEVDHDD